MAKFSPKWYKNNLNERVELKWKSCLWLQLCVASFRNYNVKFEAIEEKSSLINPVDESNVDEIQSDDELKIYKGYNEMINDLNSRGFIVNNDSFFEKILWWFL